MAAVLLMAMGVCGCDQRDLYDTCYPMLYIEGDWMPSLKKSNMANNATAVAIRRDGSMEKEYFYKPNSTTIRLTRGVYDVIIFNGMMYSPDNTALDQISFRNVQSLSTFEAYAAKGTPNKRFHLTGGETVAGNDMEILTSAVISHEIASDYGYYLKYKNGKNGFPIQEDYIESSVYLTPFALSYMSKVTVRITNPKSALAAACAVKGFAGSVFMASRMPSHAPVEHHLKLNTLRTAAPLAKTPTGTIESPDFVTFGPPLDLPGRKYEVAVSITLIDGSVFERSFDVTAQITPPLAKITANLGKTAPAETNITIPIFIEIDDLPFVEGPSIGLGDWGDDEIIVAPIIPGQP